VRIPGCGDNGDVWPSVPIIVAIWSDEYSKS
jgi:hypothetical protein